MTEGRDEFWVFGYGSLIWRPGFAFEERVPARLIGLHRALCVYSFDHRGTPEQPGLVLGLDRGGACRGVAYRVAHALREKTIAYLREREQTTNVYIEALRRITVETRPQRAVRALVFCVNRAHVQYAGRLSLDAQLHLVRKGHGRSGNNRDYVLSTVDALEALGCRDRDLHLLAGRLRSSQDREAAIPSL
jgi:cation transport protein ChaC